MPKTKILYIIESLAPYGAEKILFNFLQRLDREKYDPHVLCIFRKGSLFQSFQEKMIKVDFIKAENSFDFFAIPKIVKFIKKNNFGIVQTQLFGADVLGRIAAKIAGIKKIISVYHTYDKWQENKKIISLSKRFMDKMSLIFVEKIIVVSENLKKQLVEKGYPARKMQVIYNGIEAEAFKDTAKYDDKEVVIGIIGRLVEVKGHKYLLEAFKNISKHVMNIKLLIIGEGLLKADLMKKTEELGIKDKVVFPGYSNDIPEIFREIDIYVQPSLYEGLPTAVLEAMAAGKPVIASKVGSLREIINNNDNGILVLPANIEALQRALEQLIGSKEQRTRLGSNARETVLSKFGIERMVEEYQRVYENISNSV